jgi:Zn ribbon nucleic-acid-binding protein
MAVTALKALKASGTDRPVCKSSDHLFVPILEVTVPLLRCIHCNVFAYQETVKQLARNRAYREVEPMPRQETESIPYWRRLWVNLRRNLGFA